ncbi:TetR/AcrR family transcriptional regulator [Rhizobium mayense]|uniref:Helix-turn-helix domain-containing protein n=1 Tax=Rhizobium mayense TaxID=1312184 RepID=A0ABT7JUA9_9HYPH|nr:TetR/AcrR family transcriptional regulator [Rhizobium mayense]MDL2399913.1 helix-turn-helix domain-containing protein [Rhizobium mayense]
MRADARENYNHLLLIARDVVAEQGVNASLRDIARRANIGWATLQRHFPTREALLDALLRKSLEELAQRADTLEASMSSTDALVIWLRDAVGFVQVYSGVVSMMASAMADPESALHASCDDLRRAGARLLERAQADQVARRDLNGNDLFALIGALGWIGDQPSFASRSKDLFKVVVGAILTERAAIENIMDANPMSA